MQNQGDFQLCASSTDIVKRFVVIKSVVIKRSTLVLFYCASKWRLNILKMWVYFIMLQFTRQLVDLTRSLVKLSVD